jgi:hypothetical protein
MNVFAHADPRSHFLLEEVQHVRILFFFTCEILSYVRADNIKETIK